MSQKTQLLQEIAGKNRGLLGSEREKISLLSLIGKVEEENPTPNPIERGDLLRGNWRLLYTTSKELLSFDRFPILRTGQIYQCIHPEKQSVYNIAEVVGIPILEGIISVVAEFTVVNEKRVNVKFNRSIFGLQKILGYQSPEKYIEAIETGKKFLPFDFPINNNAEGKAWLEVTYLDEDLRISRGNQGSIFVLTKKERT